MRTTDTSNDIRLLAGRIMTSANAIQETAYALSKEFDPETLANLIGLSAQLERLCAALERQAPPTVPANVLQLVTSQDKGV